MKSKARSGLATLTAVLAACEMFPREEIVLPLEAVPPRWITVEFGNPGCPSVDEGRRRKIVVPPSGYACTSTQMDRGWVHRVFSAYDSSRRRIDVANKIHQEHTIETLSSAGKDGVRSCTPNAWFFWYGDPEKIAGDSAAAYRKRHPECPQ
jgi:hypothetical protein